MSVSSWEPGQTTQTLLDDDLQHLLNLSIAQLDQLQEQIPQAMQQRLRPMMRLDLTFWKASINHLEDSDLVHLMRVFTCCEQQLEDCFAGDRSPVIFIGKVLKARKAFPDQTVIRWIKSHSDNRFLPHGPLL